MSNLQRIVVALLLVCVQSCISMQTGFWYQDTRPPETQFDTVPFANLTVRVNRPFQDGPGEHLVTDPINPENLLFAGNTINRQTFDTQFVLDMSYALGIDVNRVYVLSVTKGEVHFTWESSNVIVNFIFLERNQTSEVTLLEAIADLTNQIQVPDSRLYVGTNVTVDVDPLWGLEVKTWDISIKLGYAIERVGENAVEEGYYLNQGSLGICNNVTLPLNLSSYCEFERFFEDDVSEALNITYYRVQILFIKAAAPDSVLVHFRIIPAMRTAIEDNVTTAVANLIMQVADQTSALYKGNVTIRTDPTWGVSQTLPTVRRAAAKFTLKYYEYDRERLADPKRSILITAYDRCKANRRCNWGIVELDQRTNDARFFQRLFDRGSLYETELFLDFEDWRMGSRGFSWEGYIPPTELGATSIPRARVPDGIIRGAHVWPFDQTSLGPDVPCYLEERNQGLILDRSLQRAQIDRQESLVADLQGRIDWLEENIEDATMNAQLRARKDVRANLTWVRQDFIDWRSNEIAELRELNTSQCVARDCWIQFNTSSLTLTGAIEDIGVVRVTEDNGTEIAVFTFNSIYLGPETEVRLVGQRALALVSKTSAVINTTIQALPGTIGGFQGGGSVARHESDTLSDTPRSIYICDLGDFCSPSLNSTIKSDAEREAIKSNNVNGPGSGNLRINSFVVLTSATYVQEVQRIITTAQDGQTLSGGFTLSYKGYSTPIIPHDATVDLMKQIIEVNLNLVPPASGNVYPNRATSGPAGVGIVSVTRSLQDTQEGFTWLITFTSAIGNVDQLTVTSFLGGINAQVVVDTVIEGNEIGGSFTLQLQGFTSDPIPAAATSAEMETILTRMPLITTAEVVRTDPIQNCDDGLCPNGPFTSRGLLWTVYVTTDANYDNISPTSPTSAVAQTEAPYYRVTADATALSGLNATIEIFFGTSRSNENPLNLLNVTFPFSLAFGGAGASYGGLGGAGYGINPVGPVYNNDQVKDLIGGSGGAMRTANPYDINAALGPVVGLGGHGGGAIEIVAASDVRIGSYGEILMRGGDGEQTPEGGGGGGSGGAIVLAAGTTVVLEGKLDVAGGFGGFGGFGHGVENNLAGGGGGGGRIGLYAESITLPGTIELAGGECGVYKQRVALSVVQFNVSVYMVMISPLDDARLAHLGERIINDTVSPKFVDFLGIAQQQVNDTIHSLLELTVTIDPSPYELNTTTAVSATQAAVAIAAAVNGTEGVVSVVQERMESIAGMNFAQVVIVSVTIDSFNSTVMRPVIPVSTGCSNHGQDGTIYTEARMATSMFVGETSAAEDTSRALYFSNRESTNTTSGSAREAPFSWNGPTVPFQPSQPRRVTYYTRLDSNPTESRKSGYGSLFSLISRGEAGLNISSVIGVFFGSQIMHGANFGSAVDEKVFLKRFVAIDNFPILDRWYKVDIKIAWENNTYSVALDDRTVTEDQAFSGDDVDGIRLSVDRAVDVWFDEIYVGLDNTMEFVCPINRRTGTSTDAPVQRTWSSEEVQGPNSQGFTQYYTMTRHYNFLDTLGSIPFDGRGAVEDFQDIKLRFATGDYPATQGIIHAGALVYLTNSQRSAKTPLDASKTLVSDIGLWSGVKDGIGGAGDGRQFWYTEYDYESQLAPELSGGVAACSSQDLVTWRFEGIVFHYTNLSDQVYGTQGPFYVERPKVLFNPPTGKYVLWAVMDNEARSLGLSAVATSPYEDGPFLFRRSFYPDGNRTRDQVTFVNEEGIPFLGRTYYETVEFLLPDAIMQPTWESAKSRAGVINFRSNYQRAVYDVGYDNFNDIFDQRWRKEDVPYEVYCENKITGVRRSVPSGVYNQDGFICDDPSERKIVVGQGNPKVETVFVSPNDTENSWWRPTSVPAVSAQAWSNNYRDGFCGIRLLDDDFDKLDPNLATFKPEVRDTCSNIADNPVHESMQDKLIGVMRVVLTRRAKFIAISELTEDFLDTTGYLNSFEGELESGALISLITELGQFGFDAGTRFQYTFSPPVRSDFETAVDYKTRFHQFIRNQNDRATYSLACVIDGVCPVNFRDQLTSGQF